MTAQSFVGQVAGPSDPPRGILTITPSDTVDLSQLIRGFMVTAAGNVSVIMLDGSTGILPACQPGAQYTARIRRIKATGTTATGIIGFL